MSHQVIIQLNHPSGTRCYLKAKLHSWVGTASFSHQIEMVCTWSGLGRSCYIRKWPMLMPHLPVSKPPSVSKPAAMATWGVPFDWQRWRGSVHKWSCIIGRSHPKEDSIPLVHSSKTVVREILPVGRISGSAYHLESKMVRYTVAYQIMGVTSG